MYNKKCISKSSVLLGSLEIGILLSVSVPFVYIALMKAHSEVVLGIVFFGAIALISVICGTALISRNGKEGFLKLILAGVVWFVSSIVLGKLHILSRMYGQQTHEYGISYRDAFIWGPFLILLFSFVFIFLVGGLYISIKNKMSDKFMRAVLILQRYVISFICIVLVIAIIATGICLPDVPIYSGG